MRLPPAARLVLLLVALASTPVAAAAATKPVRARRSTDQSWTSFGHDDQLTNDVTDAALDSTSVPRLALAWTAQLDGAVVSSPLAAVAAHSQRLLVFVSTENGSVYGLDARSGQAVWHASFAPVATPGCGTYGFSSTGAIDTLRNLLYVAGADGYVHALDLDTGAEAPGWPIRVVHRTSYGYVYGGLRLVGRALYVPLASYCDAVDPNGVPAEGRLIRLDVDARTATSFDPVPGFGNLGGIWGWGGVAAEPDGSFLYTGVGNAQSWSTSCACYEDDAGYGDSIVKLTPDLTVADWDRPDPVEGAPDEDIGAAPLLFQPEGCPPLAAANSKDGDLYVWRRDDLAAGPLLSIPLSDGVDAFVGEPSWSAASSTLVDAGATFSRSGERLGAGVLAYSLKAGCTAQPIWSAVLGNGFQPPPLIVGDVVFDADGSSGGWQAETLATGRVLWRVDTSKTATWAPLIAVDGTLVAADTNGVVDAFRPKPAAKRRKR